MKYLRKLNESGSRNEKAPPILAEFNDWLLHHITKLPKRHQLGKAIYYVLNHWEALTHYLKNGRFSFRKKQQDFNTFIYPVAFLLC